MCGRNPQVLGSNPRGGTQSWYNSFMARLKWCGIYGIFSAETGECLYVGLSKDIKNRWREHQSKLESGKHRRKDFCEWFAENLFTESTLVFDILEIVEPDDFKLNEAEVKWFEKLKPRFFGLKPSVNYSWTHSDETKAKIAASNRGMNGKKPAETSIPKTCELSDCLSTFYSKRKAKIFCSRQCYDSAMKLKNDIPKDVLQHLYQNH